MVGLAIYAINWMVENPVITAYMSGALLFLGLVYLAIKGYRRAAMKERLAGSSLAELDAMPGLEFEAWITAVIQRAGYKAENTQGSGDFGLDVIATVHGTRIGIQAKRYKRNVGNSAVQQAASGADYHSCQKAAVITQSGFTKAAIAQAERSSPPVRLIGRDEISNMVEILEGMVGRS
jgi:restriction system protein